MDDKALQDVIQKKHNEVLRGKLAELKVAHISSLTNSWVIRLSSPPFWRWLSPITYASFRNCTWLQISPVLPQGYCRSYRITFLGLASFVGNCKHKYQVGTIMPLESYHSKGLCERHAGPQKTGQAKQFKKA